MILINTIIIPFQEALYRSRGGIRLFYCSLLPLNTKPLDDGGKLLVKKLRYKKKQKNRYLIDKVDVILVELADLLQGFVVVGVDEEQVFGKQNVLHVGSLSVENRDSRVALLLLN